MEQVFSAYYAVPPFKRDGAEWVMSKETFDQVKRLVGEGVGTYLLGKPTRLDPEADGVALVPPELPKRIHGRAFLEALGAAGIIKVGDYVRRVVIDASVDGTLAMYVERWGDERLLEVATSLDGVEIRETGSRSARSPLAVPSD